MPNIKISKEEAIHCFEECLRLGFDLKSEIEAGCFQRQISVKSKLPEWTAKVREWFALTTNCLAQTFNSPVDVQIFCNTKPSPLLLDGANVHCCMLINQLDAWIEMLGRYRNNLHNESSSAHVNVVHNENIGGNKITLTGGNNSASMVSNVSESMRWYKRPSVQMLMAIVVAVIAAGIIRKLGWN